MNGADLTFEEWLRRVDDSVVALVGLSVHDLADQPFRDWYGADMSPREAARDALEAEGLDLELFDPSEV